jgi:hypothetical protein
VSRLAGAGRRRRGSMASRLFCGGAPLCERRRGAGVEDGVARGSSASGGAAPLRAAAGLLCDLCAGASLQPRSAPGLRHGGARDLDRWGKW